MKSYAAHMTKQSVFTKNKILLSLARFEKENNVNVKENLFQAQKLLKQYAVLKYQNTKVCIVPRLQCWLIITDKRSIQQCDEELHRHLIGEAQQESKEGIILFVRVLNISSIKKIYKQRKKIKKRRKTGTSRPSKRLTHITQSSSSNYNLHTTYAPLRSRANLGSR